MTVKVKKQRGLAPGVGGAVEFLAQQVIAFLLVVFTGKKTPAVTDEIIAFVDQVLVELDQIGIGVGQDIFLELGIQKNRRRAGEGFD